MKPLNSAAGWSWAAVTLLGLAAILSSPANADRSNGAGKTKNQDSKRNAPAERNAEAIGFTSPTVMANGKRLYLPHGGWTDRNRYIYRSNAGFGRNGYYSWRYGQSYSYPWNSYGFGPTVNVFTNPTYAGYLTTHIGGRPVTQFYPSYAYDILWRGDQALYRLNAYGAAQLQNVVAMQQMSEQAWAAGYRQALEEVLRLQLQGTLILRIEPADAWLYLDGNLIGTAEHFTRPGANVRLPAGRYHLEAWAEGYMPLAVDLNVEQSRELKVERKLEKAAKSTPHPAQPDTTKVEVRPTGRLVLTVSPPDARIVLDGRFVCLADMAPQNTFLSRIPAGPHRLEITRQGFGTHKEEVVISPLQPIVRRIALEEQ